MKFKRVRLRYQLLYLLVHLSEIVPFVGAFSTGAPLSVCDGDLKPRHGFEPQKTEPPAELVLDRNSIAAHQYLRITLRSTRPIKGFALRAEDALAKNSEGNDKQAFGSWYIPYLNDTSFLSEAKYLHCNGEKQNMVTHSGRTSSLYLISFQWKPPEDYKGIAVLRGTVVTDYKTYWTDISAPPVTILAAPSKPDNEISNDAISEPDNRRESNFIPDSGRVDPAQLPRVGGPDTQFELSDDSQAAPSYDDIAFSDNDDTGDSESNVVVHAGHPFVDTRWPMRPNTYNHNDNSNDHSGGPVTVVVPAPATIRNRYSGGAAWLVPDATEEETTTEYRSIFITRNNKRKTTSPPTKTGFNENIMEEAANDNINTNQFFTKDTTLRSRLDVLYDQNLLKPDETLNNESHEELNEEPLERATQPVAPRQLPITERTPEPAVMPVESTTKKPRRYTTYPNPTYIYHTTKRPIFINFRNDEMNDKIANTHLYERKDEIDYLDEEIEPLEHDDPDEEADRLDDPDNPVELTADQVESHPDLNSRNEDFSVNNRGHLEAAEGENEAGNDDFDIDADPEDQVAEESDEVWQTTTIPGLGPDQENYEIRLDTSLDGDSGDVAGSGGDGLAGAPQVGQRRQDDDGRYGVNADLLNALSEISLPELPDPLYQDLDRSPRLNDEEGLSGDLTYQRMEAEFGGWEESSASNVVSKVMLISACYIILETLFFV